MQRIRDRADRALGRRAVAPALLVLLVAGVYAPALGNGFLYDDNALVLAAPGLRSGDDLLRIFREPHWPGRPELPYYRPLSRLTIAAQKGLHGARPAPFHLFNVAVATAAALLAYAILRLPRLGLGRGPALLGAALFALHPVASSWVHPVTGREAGLAIALGLAAFLCFLGRGGGRYALALLALAGALLAREAAVVVPVLFGLADVAGLSERGRPGSALGWLRRYAAPAALVAAFLGLRALVLGPSASPRLGVLEHPEGPLLSLYYAFQVVLTPFADLVYEPREPAWRGGWRAVAWPALALGLGLAVAAAGRATRRRALFWVGWLLVALLPTANWLRQEAAFAERHVGLALLGFAGIGATLVSALGGSPRSRAAAVATGVAVVAACAAISVHRAGFYADEATFFRQWMRADPSAARPRFALGRVLQERGETRAAIRHYRRGLEIFPESASAHRRLAALLAGEGRSGAARAHLERALGIDPRFAAAHLELGRLLLEQGALRPAIEHLERATALAPHSATAREALGAALERAGRLREARRQYARSLALGGDAARLHRRLASLLERLGAPERAAAHRRRLRALGDVDASAEPGGGRGRSAGSRR